MSLPAYTSDVINIGLQQNGIESAAPDTIRAAVFDDLTLFMSDEDAAALREAYSDADDEGIMTLKKDADKEAAAELMTLPESILFQMQMSDSSEYSIDSIKTAISMGVMTKEQFLDQVGAQLEAYGDLNETYLKQIAVSFVAAEYEAQGIELKNIQNHYLLITGLKMLAVTFVMSVAAAFTGLLAATAAAKVGRTLREGIYEKVMRFTNAEMERFSTASLITRSTNDIQQIQMVTVMLLRMVAYAPILAVFGIIHVIRTGAGLSWIIVLAVILLSVCVGVLMGVAMPRFKIMQILVDRLNQVSREILTGVMPVRAFNREKHEEERFAQANGNLYKTQLFTNRTMTFMLPIMTFIMNGISVLIVWFGAKKIDLGTMRVGDLTAFITYSMVIVMSFLIIAAVSIMLPRASVAAERIVEVLDTPLSLSDPVDPEDDKIKDGEGRLVFDNVSFAYPGADACALSDISFTAEPGQVTAIIGSTGCGKTTLLNLIPRFYDVTGGSISLDGIDIRNLTQKALRDEIGYVPQKGMLFSGTIESNIRYGGDQISEEKMKEAARIAQAEEFIDSRPDGYDTEIAQEGSNVSGGQRQRLAIARAIACDPKIYLFDDSFSALDYKTDLALRTELLKTTANATVIIVAQRISTILHADKIICMDDGRITGTGTHEELMKTCETYMEIAKSQLSEAELSQIGGAM